MSQDVALERTQILRQLLLCLLMHLYKILQLLIQTALLTLDVSLLLPFLRLMPLLRRICLQVVVSWFGVSIDGSIADKPKHPVR